MIDFNDPTTWDSPMTDGDAISLGIFAINTLAEPQGSTDEQMDALDFFTEGALERLVEIRDQPAWISQVLAAVNDWSDEEFVLAFGFERGS